MEDKETKRPTKEELFLTKAKQLVDPDYKQAPATKMGLALRDTILIRRISNIENNTTEAGIILAEGAENSVRPNMGVIEACGPQCSEHIMVGQKVLYNQFANLETMIGGEIFHLVSEREINFILSHKAFVRMDLKSDKEVERTKMIIMDEKYREKKHDIDEEKKNIN